MHNIGPPQGAIPYTIPKAVELLTAAYSPLVLLLNRLY